jgi:hypothetical protein
LTKSSFKTSRIKPNLGNLKKETQKLLQIQERRWQPKSIYC